MTARTDPSRLVSSDDVPASLRDALRDAGADGPSPGEVRAITAGLGAALGPGAGGPSGAASVGGGVGAGKLAAIVGAAALIAGGLVWSAKTTSPPVPPPESMEVSAPASPTPKATETAEATPLPPPVQPEAEQNEAPPEESVISAPVSPPQRATHGEDKAKAPPPAASNTVAKPSEAALLDAARRALTQDPKRTLAYAEQHRSLYPRGMLAQEREVLVVEALRRLGRYDDAKKRDEDFRSRYPSSMHGRDIPVPNAGEK